MKFQRPKVLTYKETIRFHGHNGPFLALGYMLGIHLLNTNNTRGIMDFNITVTVKKEKPYTCVLDGLQCATCATLGKGNIRLRKTQRMYIAASVTMAGKFLRYIATPLALQMCLHQKNLDTAAEKVMKTPVQELWRQTL